MTLQADWCNRHKIQKLQNGDLKAFCFKPQLWVSFILYLNLSTRYHWTRNYSSRLCVCVSVCKRVHLQEVHGKCIYEKSAWLPPPVFLIQVNLTFSILNSIFAPVLKRLIYLLALKWLTWSSSRMQDRSTSFGFCPLFLQTSWVKALWCPCCWFALSSI